MSTYNLIMKLSFDNYFATNLRNVVLSFIPSPFNRWQVHCEFYLLTPHATCRGLFDFTILAARVVIS